MKKPPVWLFTLPKQLNHYILPCLTEEKKKGGRPRINRNPDEASAAKNRLQSSISPSSEATGRAVGRSCYSKLQIQFDPPSILTQAGPERSGQIAVPDRGVQAEVLDVPVDEEQEQQQLLEVAIEL